MSNLIETAIWEPGIYQLETSDPVMGGANGIDNLQAKQLAARTNFLKNADAAHLAAADPHPQYNFVPNLPQFDDSLHAASTKWVNDRGLAYSSLNGRPLAISQVIDPAWMGSWGEVQAANLTFTLPRANTMLVGVAFTFKCNFACQISGAAAIGALPADVIASPDGALGAIHQAQAGECLTLVSNATGNSWYIAAIGHSLATSDTRYIQPAQLPALVAPLVGAGGGGSGFGVGQTLQDMTAARALGVVYTNTTGKPIFVYCNLWSQAGGGGGYRVLINGLLCDYLDTVSTNQGPHFIVPTGGTYSITITGLYTLNNWVEYR